MPSCKGVAGAKPVASARADESAYVWYTAPGRMEGVARIASVIPQGNAEWDETRPDPATSTAPYRIYNIGNQQPTRLMDYIACIEKAAGREALKEFLPMQPGDVYQTYADSSALAEATGLQACSRDSV